MRFSPLVFLSQCLWYVATASVRVPVYLALHQQNINVLQDRLSLISDPRSTLYGKWMTVDQINQLVYPPTEHHHIVLSWLHSYPVTGVVNGGDSIRFVADTTVLQSMFSIADTTPTHLRGYHIPNHLTNIIDFVEMSTIPIPKHPLFTKQTGSGPADDRYFGREPMLKLYGVPTDGLQERVSVGLVEYQANQGFITQDVTAGQVGNNQLPNKIRHIVGGNQGSDVESELDVQMVSQAADGVSVWYWTSPYWLYSFATDFYQAKQVPQVISMSWGWSEDSQCDIIDCTNITSKQYVDRVNNEYLKIALRGVTIVVSSGDAGAPGRTNEECGSRRPINPTFPGSSPYVLSVGATYVPRVNTSINYTSPICQPDNCIVSNDERSVRFDSVGWTAGGGFGLAQNATPAWQSQAVGSYLSSGVILPNGSNFNVNGRAYPDVSAIGHSCPTYLGGTLSGIDGTSCSAPVVAGLLGIINDFVVTHYNHTLGFVNPVLYQLASQCKSCFRDVTDGYNWCTENQCCDNATDYGFNATTGYDPVSGIGTLNVGAILSYLPNILS